MKAKIYISYKEGILDPQGKTINHALDAIGIKKINSVRMGKYIEMNLEHILDMFENILNIFEIYFKFISK